MEEALDVTTIFDLSGNNAACRPSSCVAAVKAGVTCSAVDPDAHDQSS
jgi:hypothetical protein